MNVTRRTMYGLRALVAIAARQGEEPIKLREISEQIGVSGRFLQQILGSLKANGVLSSRRGPAGGYLLQRSAAEITLHDVLSVTEGPIQIVPCVGTQGSADGACPLTGRCPASPVWEDVHGRMVNLFRGVTLHDLCC